MKSRQRDLNDRARPSVRRRSSEIGIFRVTCSSVRGRTTTHMNARMLARRLWREWIRPLALPFIVITSAKSAIADINYVPTGSMKPTIVEGDVVAINKLAYDLRVPFTTTRVARWADPARGDIVV